MKALKISSLIFSVLIGILSTIIVGKLIIVDGFPKESLYKVDSLKPEKFVRPALAEGAAAITIGSKTEIIEDVFIILVEKKKGGVQLFSGVDLERFDEIHKPDQNGNHNPDKVSNHSLENLMLQVATGSGDAHAAICCTGPYTNSNGEIVARSCTKRNSACN
ncbi:hypothetical protein [Nitrosomonas sp.]|uniref:hypothetical protein n=1 Tax=Nitrosomonas sp. TaxID=42353 RepID=UPI002730C6DA|nr:hypothetical protein [Nitrosomonas sp.]MDP1786463.1 hypothetical protein [Nitrosomonas sp.]MDP2224400.1 hypothetical protein [Nitrosomonas sp.]